MRKIFTKIICFSAATVVAFGTSILSACDGFYKSKPLAYTSSNNKAEDNGGFAVAKDDYIYFINGKESNTADNTYGSVVKGSLMRISKDNLDARNYSSVETVVPRIIHSGNSNAGIFIYGDYVYYATPSTDKNSDGAIQKSNISFASSKLDGTDSMKGSYAQYTDNTIEYRYVEVDGTVYLIYVAKDEDYFKTGTKSTNIHSVNTKTNKDTLLVMGADSVTFDKNDLTNPRIFYTMKVTDFKYSSTVSYNQVYTVRADAERAYDTGAKDYSEYFKEVFKPSEENKDDKGYDPEKDPKYVNCGQLVLDGFGYVDSVKENYTPFNHPDAEKNLNGDKSSYTFALVSYQDGMLLYNATRVAAGINSTGSLYAVDVGGTMLAADWNAVKSYDQLSYVLADGSSATSYTYIFGENKKLKEVLRADEKGFIRSGIDNDGKIIITPDNDKTYYITKSEGQPTLLFTSGNYIYYSLTGGNGYTIHRVSYGGNADDYDANKLPITEVDNEYKSVKILNLDCSSDWYKPEIYNGQILFPTQTENMTDYVYIMACDLRSADGKMMSNSQIKQLNEQFDKIKTKIEKYTEADYPNLQKALKYVYFTNDGEYIHELAKAFVDVMKYDEYKYWSKDSLEVNDAFTLAASDGDWYFEKPKTVNGKEVSANRLEYYYSLVGQMSESDAKAYSDKLKTTYLQEYPKAQTTWFNGLSVWAKVGFIAGVSVGVGGLLVIGGAVVLVLVIIKKKKSKLPEYTKRRIKVDTKDDKTIDVYGTTPTEENQDTQE